MENASTPSLHPAFLPPGTQVGPWRVVDWAGGGVYGAVYRSVRVGAEQEPPVALKLALLPKDPRFAREAEMLSRQRHPHIPRLIGHGEWQHPNGTLHPYIAMEWIDGVPLYDWAEQYCPDSRQMLRLLTQVALALQGLHVQEAVHRDVKGGNILVRRWDHRVFLTDFGSSIYPGADTLTPPPLPPGTPVYRCPEAWQFAAQHTRTSTAVYSAHATDDLYALGVTACRLVTGTYPGQGEMRRDEHSIWRMDSLWIPPELFSARVEAPVRELILRLLSLNPEQRGTATQLIRDMERAAEALTPPRSRAGTPMKRTWLVAAATVGTLAAWVGWMTHGVPGDNLGAAPRTTEATDPADAGPVGLGEAAVSASSMDAPAPSFPEEKVADTPPEPESGQARPDAKGRCPHKQQVALNDGCWMKTSFEQEQCEAFGGHRYQGACYVPIVAPKRRSSTSVPAQEAPQYREGTEQPEPQAGSR